MAQRQPRYKDGNVLRLAHARTTSIDQSRLSTSTPRSPARTYEPLPPASPRQPLLSPSAASWAGSLPSSPLSPGFSDAPRSSPTTTPQTRNRMGASLLPIAASLAPVQRRSRFRLFAPLALLAVVAAVCLLSSGDSTSRTLSEGRLFASRIGNGLPSWKSATSGTVASSPSEPPGASDDPAPRPKDGADYRLSAEVGDAGELRISALPQLEPTGPDPSRRYLGYLPHSGFHNQRIELQSALLLGKILNRTVLIPPVWIGWPVPTQYYPDLRQSWLNIMLSTPQSFDLPDLAADSTLNVPADSPSSRQDFPCPTCDADDPSLAAQQKEKQAETRARWEAMGYEVRPDGFPIVPGLTAEDCKSYSPECRFTYRDTFLGWDFLVDLEKARAIGVDIASRWDVRERALLQSLNLRGDDLYVLEDRQKYDFRFTDDVVPSAPMIQLSNDPSRWNRNVSLDALRELPHRVLLVGSMHGSGRVHLTREPGAQEWTTALAQSMAFSTPWIIRPADAIVERLGGQGNFVGVHARVGDGRFAREAPANMRRAWRKLAEGLGAEPAALEEMWDRVRPRDVSATSDDPPLPIADLDKQAGPESTGSDRPQSAATSIDLPGPGAAESRGGTRPSTVERSVLTDVWSAVFGGEAPVLANTLRNLSCRSPLHPEPRFSAFNTPLYLATDSRSPETDPNLAIFFEAFPCTFVLSDFSSPDVHRNDGIAVPSVNEMTRLVNKLDNVPLGRLFLPFLEAVVAAKARLTVGTSRSTFSAFAAGDLHEAYRAQE